MPFLVNANQKTIFIRKSEIMRQTNTKSSKIKQIKEQVSYAQHTESRMLMIASLY